MRKQFVSSLVLAPGYFLSARVHRESKESVALNRESGRGRIGAGENAEKDLEYFESLARQTYEIRRRIQRVRSSLRLNVWALFGAADSGVMRTFDALML